MIIRFPRKTTRKMVMNRVLSIINDEPTNQNKYNMSALLLSWFINFCSSERLDEFRKYLDDIKESDG